MIDSKTTFLLKWAEFEKLRQTNKDSEVFAKSETEWITVRIDLSGFFYVRDTETKNFHESTPENLNRDLQNFLKKYMRDHGIEPPPKLSKAQEGVLIECMETIIHKTNGIESHLFSGKSHKNYRFATVDKLEAHNLLERKKKDWRGCEYHITAKGRILAEYLKEK